MRRSFTIICMIAFWVAPAKAAEMTFEVTGYGGNCSDCQWIQADGDVVVSSASRLEQYLTKELRSYPYNFTIRLNSPGGSLEGGVKLGELIRRHHFDTEVGSKTRKTSRGDSWSERTPGSCISACAYAFIGGVRREAKANEIGVHQFYDQIPPNQASIKLFTATDLSERQAVSAYLIEYAVRMGVDPKFVSIASKSPQIHFFDSAELDSLRVNWDPDRFGCWTIKPSGRGAVAVSKTPDGSKTALMFCRSDRVPRLQIFNPAVRFDLSDIQGSIFVFN